MKSSTFRITETEPGIKCLVSLTNSNKKLHKSLQSEEVHSARKTYNRRTWPHFGVTRKACRVGGVVAEAGWVSHQAKGSRPFKAARTKALRQAGACTLRNWEKASGKDMGGKGNSWAWKELVTWGLAGCGKVRPVLIAREVTCPSARD